MATKNYLMALLWLGTPMATPVFGQTNEVIVMENDVIPEGRVTGVGSPSIRGGTVTFAGSVDPNVGYDSDAVLRHDSDGLTLLAIDNQVLPGGVYELEDMWTSTPPIVTRAGDVLFGSDFGLVGTANYSTAGLFLWQNATGTIRSVARDGDSVPNGNGLLNLTASTRPAANESGQIAFHAEVYGANGGLGNGSGIFRDDGGSLTRIVRTGQVPPDGVGYFDGFSWPSINNHGEVAFLATIGGAEYDAEGIYVGSSGALTEIARNNTSPFPAWTYTDLTPTNGFQVNDSGTVAFRAQVYVTGYSYRIFTGDGTTTDHKIGYGNATSSGSKISSISRSLPSNNRGQVAFTAGILSGGSGIFRIDGYEALSIAETGNLVPGTVSGTFVSFNNYDFALNAWGDVAFLAQFQNGGSTEYGLFFYNDTDGLVQVVWPGTPLAGGTVADIWFVGSDPWDFRPLEPTGLDNEGRVAFKFRLTNGAYGIAVYQSSIFFRDGFESGDTTAWSSATP